MFGVRRIASFSLLAAIAVFLALGWWTNFVPSRVAGCRVTALDIGQGDAILIQTPDRREVLIDGGPGPGIIPALERHRSFGDQDIDLVVATHPDSDHIGGLPQVLDTYRVQTILTTGVESNSAIDRRWRAAQDQEGAARHTVRAGESYQLGASLRLNILWPAEDWLKAHPKASTNDTSIIIQIHCAGSTMMLTGDATTEVEDQLIESRFPIHSAALKVGHHGSAYSTSSRFIRAVRPGVAIISVGAKNRYGHPTAIVLSRLSNNDVQVRRTDLEGDVTLTSDGRGGWR